MPRGKHAREELEAIIADDKPEYVRTLFDSIAGDYNRMNWIMTGGLLALWHRAFVKATELGAGQTALDVCCGTGDLSLLMARRVGPTGSVVGLDFSGNMLAIAQERADALQGGAEFAKAQLEWEQGDAMRLPYPDGGSEFGFHAVTMGFALRNVADISRSLAEMARVARTGGRIVCLEVSRPENPAVRLGFNLYFFRIVPILGHLAEKRLPESSRLHRLRPYTYLPYSLERLPAPREILRLMEKAGMKGVRRQPLTGGLVSIYTGVKKS